MKKIQEPEVCLVKIEEIDIISTSEDSQAVGAYMTKSKSENANDDDWGF